MVRRKKKSKIALGFWYVVTILSTSALTGIFLSIFLSDTKPENWKLIALALDIILLIVLISTKRFVTSETIAYGKKIK